jgi:hypothetical protein
MVFPRSPIQIILKWETQMLRKIRILLIVAVLGSVAGLALSQDPVTERPGASRPTVQNTPAAQRPATATPAVPNAASTLTHETVLAALKKIDSLVQSGPLEGNGVYYRFTVNRDGRPYVVVLKSFGTVFWFSTNLGVLDNQKATAEVLKQLLAEQYRTGPSFFRLASTEQGIQLEMAHRVDRGITSDRFLGCIGEFVNDIGNSRTVWSLATK